MIFAIGFFTLMFLGALGLLGVYDFRPKLGGAAIAVQVVSLMAMAYSVMTFALKYLP